MAGRREELARYDKVHLFRPNGEFDLWDPGDRYVAVRLKDWTLGLLNCNDLRFPEQARALRLQTRCDALVAPAWWPWRRDHVWRALLQARAIENAVFTVGCCISASEHPDERFAGAGNHVFDPLGDPVHTQDDHTYVLEPPAHSRLIVDPLESYVDIRTVEILPNLIHVQPVADAGLGEQVAWAGWRRARSCAAGCPCRCAGSGSGRRPPGPTPR